MPLVIPYRVCPQDPLGTKPMLVRPNPGTSRSRAPTRARRDGNPADHLVYKNSRPRLAARNPRATKTLQIEKLPRSEGGKKG